MKQDRSVDVLDTLAGLPADAAYERLGDLGDGLPVAAPSEPLLDAMVAASGRGADDVVVLVPPLRGRLTVGRLAVVAALAGCEPRYMPVLLAACDALIDPDLNTFGFLTTTGSAAPLLLVNGPSAQELGFNSGGELPGPRHSRQRDRRALRLTRRRASRAAPAPGSPTWRRLGQPAKYTCCFAENEAASPWTAFHVDRGFAPTDSTVTMTAIAGTVETFDAESGRTDDMLEAIAAVLAGSAPILDVGRRRRIGGGQPLVLLSPEWATQLARVGLSKPDIQATLHERATRVDHGGGVLQVADTPDDVLVVVAGGVGVKQTVVPNWTGGTRAVTRPIGPHLASMSYPRIIVIRNRRATWRICTTGIAAPSSGSGPRSSPRARGDRC